MSSRANRGLAVALSSLFLAASSAGAESAPANPAPAATPTQRLTLKDAIDIHTHLDPDSFGPHSSQAERRLDVTDMARRAKKAGMRGFVIKQHYDQTAALAYVVGKEVSGLEVFGMLCMNLTVGGLNPDAVYHFAEVKGGRARILSMPTWDSENNIRTTRNPTRKGVPVSRNGELLPEAKAVIAAVAAAKVRDTEATLTLATGHISAEEGLMVVREAHKQGVARILVTHAMGAPVSMTLAQMQEAVGLGAYIEFVGGFVAADRPTITIQQYYDAIRALGPEHVVLSSDAGQVGRSFPDDLMALVASQLSDKGMTVAELHRMMVENPAKLLGAPQPGAH